MTTARLPGGMRALLVAGRLVSVRELDASDVDTVRDLHGRLADQDRYLRFFGGAPAAVQAHGLGTLLLEHLASMARRRGVTRFVAETLPEVAELDLNPVVVRPDGHQVLDARVRLSPRAPTDPFLRTEMVLETAPAVPTLVTESHGAALVVLGSRGPTPC